MPPLHPSRLATTGGRTTGGHAARDVMNGTGADQGQRLSEASAGGPRAELTVSRSLPLAAMRQASLAFQPAAWRAAAAGLGTYPGDGLHDPNCPVAQLGVRGPKSTMRLP